MARRSARTTNGSVPEGRVEPAPSHSLINTLPVEEVPLAPVIALEGRMRQMEEQQTEMLTLLRNLEAPAQPASPVIPPPLVPNHAPLREAAQEEEVYEEEYSDAASSARPARPGRGTRGEPLHHQPGAGINQAIRGPTREEIRDVIAEEYGQVGRRGIFARRPLHHGSPLAQQLLAHPVPHGFKLPSIESFDGTEDPLEHVNHFTTIMRICNAADQLLCQVFPATLKGQARTWFHSLREGSINNFTELARLFTDQFVANRRIVRDPSHLSGIRQNEGETLKDFFRRFTTEARQIPGVDPELLRGVFLGGLRPGGFYSALMRETVSSYPDLVHRVEAQIAADEAIEAHRQQFEGRSKRKREESSSQTVPDKNNKQHNTPSRDQGSRHHQDYTPLNTTRTNVLLAICDHPTLQRPRALAPNSGDQSKYCDYHQGHGHKTEDCSRLKSEIERFVRLGLLEKFLQTKDPEPTRQE